MAALKLACALLALAAYATGAHAEFRLLHSFSGADGRDLYNRVVLADGALYTTAVRGGEHDKGTLVRYDLAAGSLAVLHHFDGRDGRAPFNLSAAAGGQVYGITRADEVNYKGVLFRHDIDSERTRVLHRFAGPPTGAEHPLYAPLLHRGQLYGLSTRGGLHNQGALYRIDTDGRGFALLHSFAAGSGTRPFGGLLALDGWLVGTASDITLRGRDDPANTAHGVVFRIRPDGRDYQVVHRFAGGDHGGHPYGGLRADGRGWLYGTTLGEYNNLDDEGVVFRLDTSFQRYEVLHRFSARAGDGSKPNGDLVFSADGERLYGFAHGSLTAPTGPDSPFFGTAVEPGTLFELRRDGGGLRVLHRFDSPAHGLVPERTPVLHRGVLYGAAAGGGEHDKGVLFAYTLEGFAAATDNKPSPKRLAAQTRSTTNAEAP